jgi:spore coat protein CotH
MKIIHTVIILALNLLIVMSSFSQLSTSLTSNLPIVIIDTDGQSIPDEPKRTAYLKIIYNGDGLLNSTTDSTFHYDGWIGIERRGSSTQQFPKKSYSLETRLESGENNNVELLGLPRENDWILYAPFSDKTLMRNALIFKLSNETGWYAPRTRFCEVILNDEYIGVYVFMEKIKRDRYRVDIATLNPEDIEGDQLTGGYIMRIDWPDNGIGWYTDYSGGGDYSYGGQAKIMYHDPKGDELVQEQQMYIKDYITEFEESLQSADFADLEHGYRRYINEESFYNYYIFQELANNVDAYSLSTFFYKDRDSTDHRITMGPLWDFNHSLGNVDYGSSHSTSTFSFNTYLDPAPHWWHRLLQDTLFVDGLSSRWLDLRQNTLSQERILAVVDSFAFVLAEAQERNFEKWEILGEYVWPNYFIGDTYEEEIDYMRNWISHRLNWLDNAFPEIEFEPDNQPEGPVLNFNQPTIKSAPNPFSESTSLIFYTPFEDRVNITVYNLLGQKIATIVNQVFEEDKTHTVYWDGRNDQSVNVGSGVYFYIFEINYEKISVNKMIKL